MAPVTVEQDGPVVTVTIDRPEARITPAAVRYIAFTAPGELVVGYGLHLRRKFADLDDIVLLAGRGDG